MLGLEVESKTFVNVINKNVCLNSQFLEKLKFRFKSWRMLLKKTTQPTITYSKLTIETLEQDVKYVQS